MQARIGKHIRWIPYTRRIDIIRKRKREKSYDESYLKFQGMGRLTKTRPSVNEKKRIEDGGEKGKKMEKKVEQKNGGRSLSKYVNQILCVVG